MTLTELLLRIDWRAPWWQPWRGLGQHVAASTLSGHPVHEALNKAMDRAGSASLRFVPQSALPDGRAYEAFIFETKTVPTRENLHDFFNGLVWLRFPKIKAQLNALQHAEIQKNGARQLRGPLRDALTLFDENAAFLSAQLHAPVIEALRQHDWPLAFITHRSLLAARPPILFGHALLEKLASPYKSITAHVFAARDDHIFIANTCVASLSSLHQSTAWAQLDTAVAAQLDAASLLPKPFVPLPVLGVPGWWRANEAPHFYADSAVFRPPRP